MRDKINKIVAEFNVLATELDDVIETKEIIDQSLLDHEEARIIIQKAAQITQKSLETHISGIVSKALEIVYLDEAKEFIIEFVTRRNTTECDLWFQDGNNLVDPLDSSGFGEADVASFALRVAYWALGTTRNTLIVDEPFRNLDGVRMERAAEMVKYLSEELILQMILVTHEDSVKSICDKRFHIVRKNKIAKVV